jgi:hypothetical protein
MKFNNNRITIGRDHHLIKKVRNVDRRSRRLSRLLNASPKLYVSKASMTTDKGPPIQKVAPPSVNTPDGCHRNSLENSNICVFGNIQTLTRVFPAETDMRLSQRNLGAPPVANEIRNQGNER